jgi:hypothetical protein
MPPIKKDRAEAEFRRSVKPMTPVETNNPKVPMEVVGSRTSSGPNASYPHLSAPNPQAPPGSLGQDYHITDICRETALGHLPQYSDGPGGPGTQPVLSPTRFVLHRREHRAAVAGSVPVLDRHLATNPGHVTGDYYDVYTAAHQPKRGTGQGAAGSPDQPEHVRIYNSNPSGIPISPRSQRRQR